MVQSDLVVILKALKFSATKHRNQRRKDRDASPYINHPIDVAEVLLRVGDVTDTDVIVAAILHDTVEDTHTTKEEIENEFGQKVRELVMEVTDDKTLDKSERKRLQIEHAPHKSSGAKQIKIADKTSNLNDILISPPADWSIERRREYLDWSEKVVAGLRGVNPLLEKLYDDTLLRVRKSLNSQSSESKT